MAIKPVKVSQLNQYIGRSLKTDPLLSDVTVIGEISNLKYHSSGHVYFDLKDEKSRLRCFLGSWVVPTIRYELEDGMEILCAGGIQVYEPGGYYSLSVKNIEVEGRGDLARAYEKLKNKLEEEGLFDPARKKTIPAFPDRVAVITAETGAAIQDILKIITSRNDMVDVLLCPALVQGEKAAPDLADALKDINKNRPDVDTIIIGRGGGSMEDLWAFNEEVVARAIAASRIPVISAVGHETDVTIADFVADLRAETPTAAAHIAVPDSEEVRQRVRDGGKALLDGLEEIFLEKRNQLESLDLASLRQIMENQVDYHRLWIRGKVEDMTGHITENLQERRLRLTREKGRIEAGSPRRMMERGYVAITDEEGRLIRRISALEKRDRVRLVGADGRATATIEEVNSNEQ